VGKATTYPAVRISGAGSQGYFTVCIRPIGQRMVAVTLPEGKVERFTVGMSPECVFGSVPDMVDATFTPMPGTASTLTALSNGGLLVQGNTIYDGSTGEAYNPKQFQLTTQEGFVYTLDDAFGIENVIDPWGNALIYSRDGIRHSNGQGIAFQRDGNGRYVAECFREPDAGIFGLSYAVSMGQWLSLPMIAAGVAMLVWSKKAAAG
jgi:hypothetical protein